MPIPYKDAVPELLKAFPEFQPAWNEELAGWLPDTPTTDYAFGVLEAFVLEYLDEHPDDEVMLQRYLDFIELVAETSDREVQDVVFTSFLEAMPAEYLDGRVRIGPATTRLLDDHI